jgi:hypothetical protein
VDYLKAWLDFRTGEMLERISTLRPLKIQEDPEAIFQEGWLLCDVGEHARALGHLRRAVDKGYYAAQTLASRPQFNALRERSDFRAILETADAGRQRALATFREAGGEALVGR